MTHMIRRRNQTPNEYKFRTNNISKSENKFNDDNELYARLKKKKTDNFKRC